MEKDLLKRYPQNSEKTKKKELGLMTEIGVTLSAMSLAVLLIIMAYEADEKDEENDPIEEVQRIFRNERYFLLHHPDGLHDIIDFDEFQQRLVSFFKKNNFTRISFARKKEPVTEYGKNAWDIFMKDLSAKMKEEMENGKSTKDTAEMAIGKIREFQKIVDDCRDGIPNG